MNRAEGLAPGRDAFQVVCRRYGHTLPVSKLRVPPTARDWTERWTICPICGGGAAIVVTPASAPRLQGSL